MPHRLLLRVQFYVFCKHYRFSLTLPIMPAVSRNFSAYVAIGYCPSVINFTTRRIFLQEYSSYRKKEISYAIFRHIQTNFYVIGQTTNIKNELVQFCIFFNLCRISERLCIFAIVKNMPAQKQCMP